MIACPDCGSSQYPGTLFCNECGKLLLGTALNRRTSVLPFSDFNSRPLPVTIDIQDFEPVEQSKHILVLIPSSRRRLELTLKNQIRIGRADHDAKIIPELDFTQDQGIENGISRLHAVMQLTKQGVLLTDLDSTNGTYLNKVRIPTQRPVLLQSGDEVRFGDLLVHIFFD